MKIREATQKDIPDVLKLWLKTGLPVKPEGRDKPEKLAKQMTKENMWILIAEENKKIIGAVLVSHDTRKGWINRLATNPQRTREGIATKLLRKAEKSLEDVGIEVFAALITEDNQHSRILFEKENYQFYEEITYYSKRLSPES
ncbi:MAG: GNAT family N-acetyltransferase [Asgard group archaeon]|nr:GNAT family N-acetyltransferase [Asgard group archaeon]